jgi:hypothetical protein
MKQMQNPVGLIALGLALPRIWLLRIQLSQELLLMHYLRDFRFVPMWRKGVLIQ